MFSLICVTFAYDILCFMLKLLAWSSCGLGLGLALWEHRLGLGLAFGLADRNGALALEALLTCLNLVPARGR